jgi:hypothetical protein
VVRAPSWNPKLAAIFVERADFPGLEGFYFRFREVKTTYGSLDGRLRPYAIRSSASARTVAEVGSHDFVC